LPNPGGNADSAERKLNFENKRGQHAGENFRWFEALFLCDWTKFSAGAALHFTLQ